MLQGMAALCFTPYVHGSFNSALENISATDLSRTGVIGFDAALAPLFQQTPAGSARVRRDPTGELGDA